MLRRQVTRHFATNEIKHVSPWLFLKANIDARDLDNLKKVMQVWPADESLSQGYSLPVFAYIVSESTCISGVRGNGVCFLHSSPCPCPCAPPSDFPNPAVRLLILNEPFHRIGSNVARSCILHVCNFPSAWDDATG